ADCRDPAMGRGGLGRQEILGRRHLGALSTRVRSGGCERRHHLSREGRPELSPRARQCAREQLRLYTIVNGKRSTIASARVTEPKLGVWHTIRVVAVGPKIQAYLNGAMLLDHQDKTFADGWVGLWTKADSVTEFS